ncbi:hypothetical protein [Tropicimonas sediminicola]|uniref:Uncharacterized protein n=1 Tax=Tropicimonas sediminicola TaxID=1031541 RepID=A0A239HX03_9RHOB|nr:hypothetical protein [Tropicimonas sediminicola]SNS85926.1 hypothetical protein SAMN05421757_10479 [Tropicimonas sediminicola]
MSGDFEERKDASVEAGDTADLGRRAALSKIGLLAGAAPAVVMLLTPSESRAEWRGGSCVDWTCPDVGDPDSVQQSGPQL